MTATRVSTPEKRNPASRHPMSMQARTRVACRHVIHRSGGDGDRLLPDIPIPVVVRGRELVEHVLEQRGVVDVKEHRSLRTTIGRLVAEGVLVRILPAVYVRRREANQIPVMLRALFAWAPRAVLIGDSARAIASGSTPRLPLRIALHSTRTPPRWVRITRRGVAREHIRRRSGVRFASSAWLAVRRLPATAEKPCSTLRDTPGLSRELMPILAEFRGASANRTRNRIVRQCESDPHSVAEHKLHNLLRDAGIDGWVGNHAFYIDDHLVVLDGYFPDAQLALEFDSWAYHSSKEAFERDRLKQLRLLSIGISTLRITWRMLKNPDHLVSLIRASIHATRHVA